MTRPLRKKPPVLPDLLFIFGSQIWHESTWDFPRTCPENISMMGFFTTKRKTCVKKPSRVYVIYLRFMKQTSVYFGLFLRGLYVIPKVLPGMKKTTMTYKDPTRFQPVIRCVSSIALKMWCIACGSCSHFPSRLRVGQSHCACNGWQLGTFQRNVFPIHQLRN